MPRRQRPAAGHQVGTFITHGLELPHAANPLEVADRFAAGQPHRHHAAVDRVQRQAGHGVACVFFPPTGAAFRCMPKRLIGDSPRADHGAMPANAAPNLPAMGVRARISLREIVI